MPISKDRLGVLNWKENANSINFSRKLSLCFSLSFMYLKMSTKVQKNQTLVFDKKKEAPNAFKDLGSFIYVGHNFLIGLLDTSGFFLPLKNRCQNTLRFCVQRAVTLYRNKKKLALKKHISLSYIHHHVIVIILCYSCNIHETKLQI